jgi:ABC-type glycerol-3-phosphate transport system permease component
MMELFKNIVSKFFVFLFLFLFMVFILTPFITMIVTSLKSESTLFSEKSFFPKSIDISNYINIIKDTDFLNWLKNSLIAAVGRTVLSIFICTLAGFGFAKYNFKGKHTLFMIVLLSVTIPSVVTIIPMFIWMSRINWIDSYQVLIIPAAANAFGIYLCRQYILGINDELIDSARIDGCSEFKIYYRMILPLIKPAIGALAIFIFLTSWTEYLWPLIMISSGNLQTYPLGLATLYTDIFTRKLTLLMAGTTLVVLAPAIIFLTMQKQFVAGLTAGSIKE